MTEVVSDPMSVVDDRAYGVEKRRSQSWSSIGSLR